MELFSVPEEDLKAHLPGARVTPGSLLAGRGCGLTLKLCDGTKTGIRHPKVIRGLGTQVDIGGLVVLALTWAGESWFLLLIAWVGPV